ncbi:hypothetical protein Ddye_000620 [Dipteronia dyeriana]|uniref:Endonuclease/exonuclease/phosphatase domain-containing protein n=1 Tax=Dipteronia dyeriana TaxID=168575 RepID=A0AAD9XMJ8_9ROSI|nr:hypothetical protein Ddye_000620 [Dipteronia dyeriana]
MHDGGNRIFSGQNDWGVRETLDPKFILSNSHRHEPTLEDNTDKAKLDEDSVIPVIHGTGRVEDIANEANPDLLFLMETKCDQEKMEKWCVLLGFDIHEGNCRGSRASTDTPDNNQRFSSWTLLRRLAGMSRLPWVCMGDFNEVLRDTKKLVGTGKNWKAMTNFREALDDCELKDMGFVGPKYTWSNKREGSVDFVQVG